MTTTVRVLARAAGAKVETNGETVELGPHQNRDFQIEEGSQSFTVTQFTVEEATQRAEAVAAAEVPNRADELMTEEVPGQRQNDELLGKTETTTTTEPPSTDTAPLRGRGKGGADI